MSQNKYKRVVGFQIPDQLFNLINLSAFSEDVSRSTTIRRSLVWWFDAHNINERNLIEICQKKLQGKWLIIKSEIPEKGQKKRFKEFIDESRKALQDLNVNESSINAILKFDL